MRFVEIDSIAPWQQFSMEHRSGIRVVVFSRKFSLWHDCTARRLFEVLGVPWLPRDSYLRPKQQSQMILQERNLYYSKWSHLANCTSVPASEFVRRWLEITEANQEIIGLRVRHALTEVEANALGQPQCVGHFSPLLR
jgi:hypothetical protein